jgi:ribosomal protein S18 acetylase RimI-like enzyme
MDGRTPEKASGRTFRRLRRVIDEEGARGLFLRALERTCFRHVVLFERELVDFPNEFSDVPIAVRPLERVDLPAYACFRPDAVEEATDRLAAGHLCFAAWSGARIVAVSWFKKGAARLPVLERELELDPQTIYAYDSWTDPELRGHNIASARASQSLRMLHEAGYERLVSYVLPENRAGLKPPQKIGMQRAGVAGFVQLGPIRIDFLRWRGPLELSLRRSPRLRGQARSLHSAQPALRK